MPLTRITSDMLEDLTVGTSDLADSAVTAVKLATDAVETAKIKDLNVTTAKLAANAVTPAKLSQPLTHGTAMATTSGTEKDFTGIPSWVRRITVSLAGVSLSGTALLRFRLGTSGGFATSGYVGAGSVISAGAATANQTAGFDIYTNVPNATYSYSGTIEFICVDPTNDIWAARGTFATGSVTWTHTVAGHIDLSGPLTQVRLTTSNGTDTFDAGTINIHYE
jgi:hypothetical protein